MRAVIALQIIDTGEFLDLPEDIQISMEWTHPLFETETDSGSFSYPLKFPKTPHNNRCLNYANNVLNSKLIYQWDVMMHYDGKQQLCVLKLQDIKDVYDAYLVTKESVANSILRNSMKTLDWSTIEVDEYYQYYWYQMPSTCSPGLQINIAITPIYSTPFTINETYGGGAVNDFLKLVATAINTTLGADTIAKVYEDCIMIREQNGGNSTTIGNFIVVVSYIGTGTWTLLEHYDPPQGTPWDHSSPMEQHVLHSRANMYAPRFRDRIFPAFVNTEMFNNEKDALGNDLTSITWFNFADASISSANKNGNYSAMLYFFAIIKNLIENIGYIFTDNLFDDELKTIWLYNNFSLLATDPTMIVDVTQYDLTNSIPDKTSLDLLNCVRQLFCAAFFFDNTRKKVELSAFKDIVKTAPIDLSQYIDIAELEHLFDNLTGLTFTMNVEGDNSIHKFQADFTRVNIQDSVATVDALPTSGNNENDVRLVTSLNQYFIVNKSSHDSWVFYSENLGDIIVGDGSTNITIPASPMLNSVFVDDGSNVLKPNDFYKTHAPDTWKPVIKVPYIEMKGDAPFSRISSKTNPGFHFAFWRGNQPVRNPKAGGYTVFDQSMYDNRDANNNRIGNYSLALDGDDGIKNVFYKEWIDFNLNGRSCSIYLSMPGAKLFSLKWQQMYYAHGFEFIIKKIYPIFPITAKTQIDILVRKIAKN